MFSFLKLNKQTESKRITDNVQLSTSTKYGSIVDQIHNEFQIAADVLLEEAKKVIKEAESLDVAKSARLEKLGFNQVPQVTEIKPLLEKAELSQEQINLVNYYKLNYPLNKFITEEQVKAICHKYNLVCGEVGRFKGFVPEKNLREIENFKLKEKEANCVVTSSLVNYKNETLMNSVALVDAEIRKYGSWYWHIHKKGGDRYTYAFQSEDGVNFYAKDQYNLFNLSYLGEVKFTIQKGLRICAPVKDMDISGLELVEGYKLTKKHIPDPVVLQPVSGGYLILTAWGDEASDPLVVNEMNN